MVTKGSKNSRFQTLQNCALKKITIVLRPHHTAKLSFCVFPGAKPSTIFFFFNFLCEQTQNYSTRSDSENILDIPYS